jgi:hypothetical protein
VVVAGVPVVLAVGLDAAMVYLLWVAAFATTSERP